MKNLPVTSYLTAIYLFFYIPIIVLIVYSFNNAQYSLLWHGFSMRWYHELFADMDLWIAVAHSLILRCGCGNHCYVYWWISGCQLISL